MFSTLKNRLVVLVCTVVVLGSWAAFAQVATTLEQAELAGLNPNVRTEVESRAVRGNTVYEVFADHVA